MKKTDKERQEQTKKARKTRESAAEQHDIILERKIQEIPGLTYVQLEKVFSKNKYQFKKSYLKNALVRLEKDLKKIMIIHSISKDGKIVNKYYPIFSKQKILNRKINELTIPSELLDVTEWKNTCVIYGVKNNEIVIAPKQNDKFEEISFHKKVTSCKKIDEKLIIDIPKAVSEYYDLTINNINITYQDNAIYIQVTPRFTKQNSTDALNILLLEDNPFWANAFQKILANAGHAIYPFSSVEVAEEFAKNKHIDWLVLDDDIDNSKEAKKFFIKLKKEKPKIHGIFITSYPITEKKREELTDFGFKSIIAKKEDNKERDPEEVAAEQLVRIET